MVLFADVLILNFSEKVYFFQKKEKLHLIFLQI